jgi:hypothetical protein
MPTATKKIKKSNDLRYRAVKITGNEKLIVNIRLNDECNNGHQDFSITGDTYEKGNWTSGGCIHDTIAEQFPEFIPFIKLHLSDYKGIPKYAAGDGFYRLREGFNSKSKGEDFKAEYCDYYRVTPAQFDQLNTSENEIQFSLMLQSLGILEQWETEAKAAIKQLEELTHTQFVVDSRKSQYTPPTAAEIAEENKKQAEGYYTPEAKEAREVEKGTKILAELEAETNKNIQQHRDELEVKKAVFHAGGKKALDNCIFYNHTNTLAFNWLSYGQLSDDEINTILAKIVLPEGVKTEIKSK